MEFRLPYYMSYPLPLEYDDARLERRDMDYMTSLYPERARLLLPYVEEECDRMAYAGSMVYDEYPDKLLLRLLCARVLDRAVREERIEAATPKERETLRELVDVLVYQELMKRRREERRTRSRFF